MGLAPGSHRISRSHLIHMGQEIPFEVMDLELSPLESGELSVYASATMRAKVTGLSPGKTDIEVLLEWEGEQYRIANATVFDVDIDVSGVSTVQLTGKLEPLRPDSPQAS